METRGRLQTWGISHLSRGFHVPYRFFDRIVCKYFIEAIADTAIWRFLAMSERVIVSVLIVYQLF